MTKLTARTITTVFVKSRTITFCDVKPRDRQFTQYRHQFQALAYDIPLPNTAVMSYTCLLYTSDAADEQLRVDLGGRRIIKKIFFQAEDGIRDPDMSRGLGDVYKRQR